MEEFKNLLYEFDDGIGIVTINRPQALNALNKNTVLELSKMFDIIAQDDAVKVVILTGSGDKAFVAGADIAEMQAMSPVQARDWSKLGQAVFNKLENLPKPVIAAVNGFALGGGCELAMACDIRIAADKAKFGQPEVNLGITPGFAGTQRLPRLVGRGKAKEILFIGDIISADEAYRIGLVNRIVPFADLMFEARAMAQKIMTRASLAVGLCKTAINQGMNMDFQSAAAYEAEVFALCFTTADQKEGMAAFTQKRKPSFTGK